MPVNQKAPVVESGRLEVAAGIEAVWQVLVAVERWPEWNPDLTRRPTATLLEVEPPRFIAWKGSTLGIKAVHAWRLDRTGGGTMVTTEESWEGAVPHLSRGLTRAQLQRAIQLDLACLKKRIADGPVT